MRREPIGFGVQAHTAPGPLLGAGDGFRLGRKWVVSGPSAQDRWMLKVTVKEQRVAYQNRDVNGAATMKSLRRDAAFPLRSMIAAAALSAAIAPTAAQGCIVYVPPTLEDVRLADLVVIGTIENYRIVRDEAGRRQRLAQPNLPSELRKLYQDPKGTILSDYARFDIRIHDVLVGQAPDRVAVTWDNSTFAEPSKMKPGRYLIALRRPNSPSPPLRGPSGTIAPAGDPKALTVLQAPCSSAFIYAVGSEEAEAVQRILTSK